MGTISSDYWRIIEDSAGEFRFSLVAGNGEVTLQSEGYKTEQGAVRGIETVERIIKSHLNAHGVIEMSIVHPDPQQRRQG
jgi:uncharacterized protein YegP (UPF0339 family)